MTAKYTEKTLSSELVYDGKIISLKKDIAELIDGSQKVREVVIHPGGVVVAAFTENNEVLFVKQFRYPAQKELIELPAGKLEKGEDPDEAIKRELEEECGYKAKTWKKVACIYATPGFCDEKLHLYEARNLIKTEQNLDEGEFLDYLKIPVNEAWEMVEDGRVMDAKSVALLGILCMNQLRS